MGFYDDRRQLLAAASGYVFTMAGLSYLYYGLNNPTVLFMLIQISTLFVGMSVAACRPLRQRWAITAVTASATFGQLLQCGVYLMVHEWRYDWWLSYFFILLGGLAMSVMVGALLDAVRRMMLEEIAATETEAAIPEVRVADANGDEDQGDPVDPDAPATA